jgi:hypothetical protein
MRAAAILVILCAAVLFAQEHDDLIEDVAASSDQESPLPTDIDADSLVEQGGALPGSRQHIRFVSSFAWKRPGEDDVEWRDTWARTKFSSTFGAQNRTEFLLVRRMHDPQTLDEVHVAVSGVHAPSNIAYALGTYQIDWGLGALNSAAYGAARRFAYVANTVTGLGVGVIPRTTSREESWLRGVALSRSFRSANFSAWANIRDWNGETDSVPARLTGVLSTASSSSLDRRDRIEENSFGGSLLIHRGAARVGLLSQVSNYSPEVTGIGSRQLSNSLTGSMAVGTTTAVVEFARSGSKSAWSAILSHGTGRLLSAFYAMYAAPDYAAPRSQSPFSFGEEFQNSRIYGLRLALSQGRHDFSLDTRVDRTPAATPTAAPYLKSEELLVNWLFRPAPNVQLKNRAFFAVRNLGRSDERFSRYFRFEPVWRNTAIWSLRAELRNTDFLHEPSGNGQYLHLQLAKSSGKFRPGFRVAVFNLDELGDPLLVYETTVDGAYPLESISGNGTRVAGWCKADFGKWNIVAKLAQLKPESEEAVHEFAIGIGYYQ